MIRRNMENGIPSAIGQLGQAFERGVLERAQLHVSTPHVHTPCLMGDECDARRDAGLSRQ